MEPGNPLLDEYVLSLCAAKEAEGVLLPDRVG